MKDFLIGMAIGVSVTAAVCCPKVRDAFMKAEKKMMDVKDDMMDKINEKKKSAEKKQDDCECGCDCECSCDCGGSEPIEYRHDGEELY